MPTTDRKLRVFLCHASQDKPIVRELHQRLLAESLIDPWLDEEKLLPGMDWNMEIEKAVESADVVIVCLSNHSVTKEGYVQRELKFVLDIALEKPEGTIFIIPLRLDECDIPRRLRVWQYADFFPDSARGKAIVRLIRSLKARAEALGIAAKKPLLAPLPPKDFWKRTAGTEKKEDILLEQAICPICRDQIDINVVSKDDIVRCGECGVLYHKYCWNTLKKCVRCGSSTNEPIT